MSERLSIHPSESRELEPKSGTPIIDVVRHGPTDYKELREAVFKFDPDAADFKLDAEHLDLTEKGIRKITETAERLAGMIDKDNEVVMFVTSPQARARSSMLLIEKVLAEHGIEMLNTGEDVKRFEHGLGQIQIKSDEVGRKWIEKNLEFRSKHPELADGSPREIDRRVAEELEMSLQDMYTQSHEQVGEGFQRFLRHAMNIDRYLTDETKERIGDKRLRIVCVTHEERLEDFAKKSLNIEGTVKKAQMMEVRPEGPLGAGGEVTADVTLFGGGEKPDRTAQVTIGFAPDRKA